MPTERKTRSSISSTPTAKRSSGPLPEISDFNIDDEWADVFNKMKDSGWHSAQGTGVVDWYYYKPGIDTPNGFVHGEDYFHSEEEVREYVKLNYGWTGPPNPPKKPKFEQKVESKSTPTKQSKQSDQNKNNQKSS